MKKDEKITALKNAMRGEVDSVNVYKNALSSAKDPQIISFFQNMVEEEQNHYNYLLEYYHSINNEEKLQKINTADAENQIFSQQFMERIGANQILFSAISVATLLEKEAFEFYKKSAAKTDDEVLKKFFLTLADWEQEHYDNLLEISKQAELTYWQKNRFEPF
ncbi:MAG: ferritin family protein [Candidatus Cloacimonetes bacterium]|nr:ferritin family protein [Candidatus Cloacimonadota bacterium]